MNGFLKNRNAMALAMLFLAALCSLLLSACNDQPSRTYSIGFISNFEGPNSQPTVEALQAATLAYKEFQRNNPHFAIEILPLDDSLDPAKIKPVYQSVRDRCDAFICITTTDAFLAIYDDVRQNADRLHMVLGVTTTALSRQDDNVIRTLVDMEVEQKSIAEFLNRRGVRELLVVRENEKNVKYTDNALEYFSKYFTGRIVPTTFSAWQLDLGSALKALAETRCDYAYVLTGGMPREAGIVAQQLCSLRPGTTVITTPWVRGPVLMETVGKYSRNLILPSHVLLSKSNAAYQQFLENFSKTYQYQPGYMAGPAYDAMKILLEALKTAGTAKAGPLKEAIQTGTFKTSAGEIRFNPFGDVEGGLFFYTMPGDGYELLEK